MSLQKLGGSFRERQFSPPRPPGPYFQGDSARLTEPENLKSETSYSVMLNCASEPSPELGPTHTVMRAGSTTSSRSMFQNLSSSSPSLNSRRFDSPGASVTRRNPFNSWVGRATLV